MTRDEFIESYGGIYEHSPWVAADAFDRAGGKPNADQLPDVLAAAVDQADSERQLALIRAHPDLAGRAAIRGELTAESTSEQASAGIDQCTPAEFERFQEFNAAYKAKFGFPFVMAVRNSSRQEILQAFAVRLEHDYDREFATAIAEIHKIAALRLQAMSKDTP